MRRFAFALALVSLAPAAAADPAPTSTTETAIATASAGAEAPRTHGVLFPTGELMEPGHVQGSLRGYGLWSTARLGLHEHLELEAQALVFLGAAAGVRVGLTDSSSPLRAVASASIWWVGDNRPMSLSLGGTLGYTADRLNIHSTISEMPLDDERMWIANAGFLYRSSPRVSVGIDAGQIALGGDRLRGAAAGFKLTGKYFDIDLAAIFSPELSSDMPMIPIVSLTGRT